jgi:hypothetical protein
MEPTETNREHMMKDCLILPCSNKKGLGTKTAKELYEGALNSILNSFDQDEVFAHFDVFFLSAKFGLIGANDLIETYDIKMADDEYSQMAFAKAHKAKANKLLKQYAYNKSRVYMILYNNYQAAFDKMNLSALKLFKTVYKSTAARGVGVHRGRLKKIIQSNLAKATSPTIFRSGCANVNEFNGFLMGNQHIGTSLAYLNKKHVMSYIVDELKAKHDIFVDNGLITAVNKNIDINESDIFANYSKIVKSVRSAQSLLAVIPDNPFNADEAIAIVERNKADIRHLAKRCQLVLPVHNTEIRTVAEQAKLLMSVIGKAQITLGIPCLNKGDNKWRMSLENIESLFALKHADGRPLFTRVHFLGLSDVSKGGVYEERLLLAQMYNVNFSCDASRITAIFGNQEECKRAGNREIRDIQRDQSEKEFHNTYSPDLATYSANDEWEDPMIINEVNNLHTQDKIDLWNTCYPVCKLDFEKDDIEGSLESFDACFDAYFYDFISKVKHEFKALFKQNITKFNGSQLREEAITRLFLKCNEQRGQVQQVMCF